jgi:hypothetical protein
MASTRPLIRYEAFHLSPQRLLLLLGIGSFRELVEVLAGESVSKLV